jgi:hypothetical protein
MYMGICGSKRVVTVQIDEDEYGDAIGAVIDELRDQLDTKRRTVHFTIQPR